MCRKLIVVAVSLVLILALIPNTVIQAADDDCAAMRQHWAEVNGFEVGTPYIYYSTTNNQLLIKETHAQKIVQVVESDYVHASYAELSPDCRYLVSAQFTGGDYGQSRLITWDLLTGERVSTLENIAWVLRGHWSPVGNPYLIIETYDAAYLWNMSTNQWMFLNGRGDYGALYSYVTWDMARNQVIVVPGNEGYMVRAYSLETGATIANYTSGTQAAPVSYLLSEDGSKIAVFTDEEERMYDDHPSGLAVWDRETGTPITLNPEHTAAHVLSQIQFSPENRYLVIARDTIRVWDLQNVRSDGLPSYQHDGPTARVGTVLFVDTTTIETLYFGAPQGYSQFWMRWNLLTGEFLYAYDKERDHILTDAELAYWSS